MAMSQNMYVGMYVCMVITYSRWINRVRLPVLLVASWTGKMYIPLSQYVPENLVSRDGFRRPVPRHPAHLHTQAEYGAYSRDSSRFPRRRLLIYSNRHTPAGQSRVYRVTQSRTYGVHCRESTGTGSVVLKVVPVTGAAILQVTMDQLMCASLFPHPLLVWSGHVDSRWDLWLILPHQRNWYIRIKYKLFLVIQRAKTNTNIV